MKPKVLIFDESTSGLDEASAEQVAETVNALRGKDSMLFIAHKTDLLALGTALEELDSSFTLDKLNALSKVGSNVPEGSLEGVPNSLRCALAGPNVPQLLASDAGDDPLCMT